MMSRKFHEWYDFIAQNSLTNEGTNEKSIVFVLVEVTTYFYWQKNCLTLWNHFPDFTRTQLTRTQHGFTWIGTICVSQVFSVKAYAMWVFHVIIVSEFKARKNQKLWNRFITFLMCSANYFFYLTLIRWPLLNLKCELQSVGN